MNQLTTKILNELKVSIFNEEDKKSKNIKTILALYPGRFQPFHVNHKSAFDWMVSQFGDKNSYVVTSNVTNDTDSPFSFKEKKKIINSYGIKKVIQTQSPYYPKEILSKYDPNTTMIVYMLGEKDKNRLSHMKRLMKYNKTTFMPFKDLENPYIYYIIAPPPKFKLSNFGTISGTVTRKALSDINVNLSELRNRFKVIIGTTDKSIFNLIVGKLNSKYSKKLKEMELPQNGNVKMKNTNWITTFKNLSRDQFKMFANILKKEYNDTKELGTLFKKITQGESLTIDEKLQFKKQMIDISKILGLTAIVAAPFPGTTLLIPIIVQLGKKYGINILPEQEETKENESSLQIVRRNFWNEVFKEVEKGDLILNELIQTSFDKINSKQLLICGGAYGHMAHIFEDMSLTFNDIKEIFQLGLSGQISVNNNVMEKTDGQNLLFTFKSNNIRAARNGSDIKNGGMSIKEISDKFEGRGVVKDAFVFAVQDLQNAIRRLNPNQIQKIFTNGTTWMSCEVIYPASANVINYDGAFLIFHGAFEYNSRGERISEHPEYERILSGMIKQVNANSQKTFTIRGQFRPIVYKSKSFDEKLSYYIRELDKIKSIVDCKDTDTLETWHRKWWTIFIKKSTKNIVSVMDPVILNGLVNRWAMKDTSFRIIKENIPDAKLFEWVRTYNRTKYEDQYNKNFKLFEDLLMKFASQVLINIKDFISINPSKTVNKIKSDLILAINKLKNSNNPKDIDILKTQLEKIQNMGGFDSIVPTEGIVFKYKGKIYKLTGIFAPVNKLLGRLKYK